MNCKKCGFECSNDDKFCKNCGEKLDTLKLCENCQKPCKPEAIYCPYCGQKFATQESKNDLSNNTTETNTTNNTTMMNNQNLVKCPYCYSDIPRYSKKCPKCGEWIKKDTNLGCYTAFFITIFILSIFISFFIYIALFNDIALALLSGFITSIAILLAVWLYFLPAWIAESKNHPSKVAIFILNLFFGVTAIGWIVAFIWALTGGRK